MVQNLPTVLQKKAGYGNDSVQRRLGEIVYKDAVHDDMVSRLGKHSQTTRDRV